MKRILMTGLFAGVLAAIFGQLLAINPKRLGLAVGSVAFLLVLLVRFLEGRRRSEAGL